MYAEAPRNLDGNRQAQFDANNKLRANFIKVSFPSFLCRFGETFQAAQQLLFFLGPDNMKRKKVFSVSSEDLSGERPFHPRAIVTTIEPSRGSGH